MPFIFSRGNPGVFPGAVVTPTKCAPITNDRADLGTNRGGCPLGCLLRSRGVQGRHGGREKSLGKSVGQQPPTAEGRGKRTRGPSREEFAKTWRGLGILIGWGAGLRPALHGVSTRTESWRGEGFFVLIAFSLQRRFSFLLSELVVGVELPLPPELRDPPLVLLELVLELQDLVPALLPPLDHRSTIAENDPPLKSSRSC